MKKITILLTLLLTISTAVSAQDLVSPGQSEERDKALIQSAFDGELAKVQSLVKKGASVEATDSKNRTALLWAAAKGHTSVVEFLHGEGADVNAADKDGRTPLMYAAKRSFMSTAEYLLRNGADVNVKSGKQGNTALTIAAAVGDVKFVRLLLEYGADKDLAEDDGNTALDRARQYGHPAVVKLLEELSAPPSNS